MGGRILARKERAGARQIEDLEIGRDGIALVKPVAIDVQPDRILGGRAGLGNLHTLRQAQIADHLVGVEAHAPGLEKARHR